MNLIEQFQQYTNIYTDNTDLQQAYIKSAQEIVENYLGYKLKRIKYTQIIKGNGTNELQLKAKPVTDIISVEIDGKEADNFYTINEFLYSKNCIFPQGKEIVIKYVAGYIVDFPEFENDDNEICYCNTGNIDGGNAGGNAGGYAGENIIEEPDEDITEKKSNLPNAILMTIFRIAALLQSESDSNIGVTSKSFGDSGNRSYTNYTNFDKYLIQISKYRLVRI